MIESGEGIGLVVVFLDDHPALGKYRTAVLPVELVPAMANRACLLGFDGVLARLP